MPDRRLAIMTPILAFDLETVPDVAGLRCLHPQWAALPDA